MNKIRETTAYFAIISLLFIVLGCGGGGGGGGSSAELKVSQVNVSVDFQGKSASNIQLKASSIINIRYAVSGPGMQAMSGIVPVMGSEVKISLQIPNGDQRCILIEGLDNLDIVTWKGESCVNLDGNPKDITITLVKVEQTSTIGNFPPFTPDSNDTEALAVIQTIPPHNSTGIDPNVTISVFFNDEIDPSTINDHSIQVKDSKGDQQFGTFSGSLSTAGNSILNFKPFAILSEGDTITVTMFKTNGIKDDGGNTLSSDVVFSFGTKQQSVPPADLGFEQGSTGWNFSGDGMILSSPKDDISAYEGNYMAAISTGGNFGGQALESTTSILTSGPVQVPAGKQSMSFNYDFISEEFDEYVGSIYDDVFKVSVSGPLGSFSEVVVSVNIIGRENSYPVNFAGLGGADHTGWLTKTIDISTLGSPIIISFEVSDVGDDEFTSVAVIDNINFQ
ncbi:MAG: hypothetical protein FJ240_07460 [Nitrospira sp.]|nr:hypothetical protein [Nitrospira sp.]